MKISIKTPIDVLYIEEDNIYEFVWIFGTVWRKDHFTDSIWHLTVF